MLICRDAGLCRYADLVLAISFEILVQLLINAPPLLDHITDVIPAAIHCEPSLPAYVIFAIGSAASVVECGVFLVGQEDEDAQ